MSRGNKRSTPKKALSRERVRKTPLFSQLLPKTTAIVSPLLDWYHANARDLPWRRTRDPYAIWVSEIMLQQTQVKTVQPYFERWMRELPSIDALAAAAPEKIHKLWEGLGYYTRVRNLQKASQFSRRYSELALSENDGAAARMARLMAGMSLVYQAEYVEASRLLERAYQEHSDVQPRKDSPSLGINARAAALGHLSPCLFARGLIDAAISAADRSIEEAEQVGQAVALCLALARPAGLLLPEVGALDRAERQIGVMQERV